MDPRTPVLVGVSAIEQRAPDPTQAAEACELMARALEAAAEDAGSRSLIGRACSIRVPRGNWRYSDPGRLIAERIGAGRARTILAEVGVMQQTLISDACRAIAAGTEEIALIAGGEARYRDQVARRAGVTVTDTEQGDVVPDAVLLPQEPLLHELELQRGLMMPVRAFAVMENARRHSLGQSLEEYEIELSEFMVELNGVARANPHAWSQEEVSAEQVRSESRSNRPLSFPYRKHHASNWTVDQAAGLILCSLEVARELGLAEEQWVHPLSAAESWHVVPVVQRAALDRSPGAEIAGARALALANRTIDQVEHLDLYSCFPAVMRIFARELAVPPGRAVTVTGGMACAGGPLNNYVIQATVRLAEVLRAHRGETGMTTCISGFLNKIGVALWSSEPPTDGFRFADVTPEVAKQSEVRALSPDYQGPARIVGYTVVYMDGRPVEAIAICDLPNGDRTLAITRDPAHAASLLGAEQCGRDISVGSDGEWL